MKKSYLYKQFFLLFCILASSIPASSQDYKLLKLNAKRFYQREDGYIRGIRIDSVKAEGADSLYFNFYSLYEKPNATVQDSCRYSLRGTSWVGHYCRYTPNGDFTFTNKEGKSLLIKTRAGKGDRWIFYSDAAYVFEATVDGISSETFIGKSDSVKTISLEVKDHQGKSMNHIFNGKKIRFSKNHGFTELFNFRDFPAESLSLTLTDTSVFMKDFYTHNPGDEFHITTGQQSAELIKYLDKWLSPGGDSIYYKLGRSNFWLGSPPHVKYDTIVQKAPVNKQYPFDYMPGEAISYQCINICGIGDYSIYTDTVCGRTALIFYVQNPSATSDPSCFMQYWEQERESSTLIKGIDLYFNIKYKDFIERLVYSKIGNKECGTPFKHPLGINPASAWEAGIQVYPNPANQELKLKTTARDPFKAWVCITDLLGKKVFESSFSVVPGEETVLPMDGIGNGIYLLTVKSRFGNASKKISIIK